jgi:chromosome partitioning protein
LIVSIVNQKGGTGKSTVATNLAVCFAIDKKKVFLIDADPQKTALDWHADRPKDMAQVEAMGLPIKTLHREIEPFRKKYEIIIIDGGCRVNATARAAIMVSDFVIIPTLPSKPDILSTQDFFKNVIEEVSAIKDIEGAILINQLQTGTVVSRKSEEYLKNLSYPLFKTILHQYVAYREAIARGLSVIEYDNKNKAAKELSALFNELKEILYE